MTHYSSLISQSTFTYDSEKGLYKTQIDLSEIAGFENVQYNATMVKVMRYIAETGGFKEVLCHSEITADGLMTIYATERFNLKVLILNDL